MLLSFLFDIPIFLPLLGIFLFWLDKKENNFKIGWILVGLVFFITALFCLFLGQWLLLTLLAAALIFSILLAHLTNRFLLSFSIFTLAIFWIVSGGLYWDLWGEGGNHFMWYSWLDKIGIITGGPIPTPTYLEPYGFWNLFGLFLFLTYPIIMLVFGKICFRFFCWLKGIFFGHIKGQSGLWGLFTNK